MLRSYKHVTRHTAEEEVYLVLAQVNYNVTQFILCNAQILE